MKFHAVVIAAAILATSPFSPPTPIGTCCGCVSLKPLPADGITPDDGAKRRNRHQDTL